jgi:hypothetical protein
MFIDVRQLTTAAGSLECCRRAENEVAGILSYARVDMTEIAFHQASKVLFHAKHKSTENSTIVT